MMRANGKLAGMRGMRLSKARRTVPRSSSTTLVTLVFGSFYPPGTAAS